MRQLDTKTIVVEVANVGSNSVTIESHAHFFEVDADLEFDRKRTFGYRLNLAPGTGKRFKSGEVRSVELVDYSDNREAYGRRVKRVRRKTPS